VVRILVLINGGAAVGILTFVGSLAVRSGTNVAQLVGITHGLKVFAWGIIFATLTGGFSYLTNLCNVLEANSKIKVWEHPYVKPTTMAKVFQVGARIFHVAALLLAVASLVYFASGCNAVGNAIAHLA
jgi:hypothetical protein